MQFFCAPLDIQATVVEIRGRTKVPAQFIALSKMQDTAKVLTLQPATGVKLDATEYPAGTSYTLAADPSEKLDVYTGAFTVKLPVVAESGEHNVDGMLHYQACDQAACYPPKNLQVHVVFTAK